MFKPFHVTKQVNQPDEEPLGEFAVFIQKVRDRAFSQFIYSVMSK